MGSQLSHPELLSRWSADVAVLVVWPRQPCGVRSFMASSLTILTNNLEPKRPRIWFASRRKPVTGIPEIHLGELETGNQITLIKTPNGQSVSEYR